MNVPFLDLRRQHAELAAELSAAAERVLAGGAYVLGREVEGFEREWADFCGARGAAGVGTGTDALALALVASGAVRPGRGDEVITTPLTAGYTALAILNAGAVPVFADINPRTLTLDPGALSKAVTPRTRAVVPVHLYGRLAEIEAICDAASRLGLSVVEDAAQAHGAGAGRGRAGTHGQAAAFSFYPTKNLGAYGDGGAVTSNDLSLIERVKELRQGGHEAALRSGPPAGVNSRLDEMQAALLRVKLRRLDEWNGRRARLAGKYLRELEGVPDLTLPSVPEYAEPAWHLFVVRHPRRDALREHLERAGVGTLIHYPLPPHLQPAYAELGLGPGSFPLAEALAREVLSLPLGPHLSEAEVDHVVAAVSSFAG